MERNSKVNYDVILEVIVAGNIVIREIEGKTDEIQ